MPPFIHLRSVTPYASLYTPQDPHHNHPTTSTHYLFPLQFKIIKSSSFSSITISSVIIS
ncbi:hypothetical protein Hanom_Chr05g00454431 [Helianthus anomalus]